MKIEKLESMAESAIFFTLGVMLPMAFPTALLMSSYQISLTTGILFWAGLGLLSAGLLAILTRKDLVERLKQGELYQIFLIWFYGFCFIGWLMLVIGWILEKGYDWLAQRIAKDLKDVDGDSRP